MTTIAHIDGQPARAEELAPLAFAGYAHFTAMQVRAGQVRGLDLHFERLRGASKAMYGQALPDELIRERLRAALALAAPDCSLTITIYPSTGEFATATGQEQLRVLVRTGAPASGPAGPLALAVVQHERTLASIKHVGEVAKTWFLRQAVAQGYDDAAFADRDGKLSEATIWNLAFWDGEGVVWPDAPMLLGTTMAIVQRQLRRMGVAQRTTQVRVADLARLRGAAVMNSWTPGLAVSKIGAAALPQAPEFLRLLHEAYRAEPPAAP